MNNIYYVYAYLRKSDGSPYYIGKGKGRRAFRKRSGISTPKDTSKIIFIKTNLSEEESFSLERELVSKYGRKDIGTGILLNRTNGGDGTSGKIVSEEQRIKMRQLKFSYSTRKRLSEVNMGNKNALGSIRSPTTIQKLRNSKCKEKHPMWMKNHSNSSKSKISSGMTGMKFWNNGSVNKRSRVSPGDNWVAGRL